MSAPDPLLARADAAIAQSTILLAQVHQGLSVAREQMERMNALLAWFPGLNRSLSEAGAFANGRTALRPAGSSTPQQQEAVDLRSPGSVQGQSGR